MDRPRPVLFYCIFYYVVSSWYHVYDKDMLLFGLRSSGPCFWLAWPSGLWSINDRRQLPPATPDRRPAAGPTRSGGDSFDHGSWSADLLVGNDGVRGYGFEADTRTRGDLLHQIQSPWGISHRSRYARTHQSTAPSTGSASKGTGVLS